jgi:hypothetical protein
VAVALAGCGGDEPVAPAHRDAADIVRAKPAAEAVFFQRMLGDDPVSESVSLRVDGTAAVRRRGGRGYWDAISAARRPRRCRRTPWPRRRRRRSPATARVGSRSPACRRTAHGAGAGPLVLDGLQRGSRGRAIRADAVVQPGGDVTLSVGPARFPGASSCAGAAA